MGYMTTLTILNDCMDQIRKYPEQFVEGIFDNYHDGGVFGVGYCANPVEVMPTHHADDHRLYIVGGNTTLEINPWNRKTQRLINSEHDFQRNYVESSIRRAKTIIDIFEEQYSVVD